MRAHHIKSFRKSRRGRIADRPEERSIGQPLASSSSASSSVWDDDPRGHAARGVEVARALCACDYPYQVLWPILRAAGITGSLRYQEDEVLAPVLSPLLENGTRVLIAGSADT